MLRNLHIMTNYTILKAQKHPISPDRVLCVLSVGVHQSIRLWRLYFDGKKGFQSIRKSIII